MLSMNNKKIYFAHKVSLSRLNSKFGYPDYVNMTRNVSHFVIAKIGPHCINSFCHLYRKQKVLSKTNHMTFHTLP